MATKYKNKSKSVPSDHNGRSTNDLKPQCIAGMSARGEGKKRSDNPYPRDTQSYRRWERGYENHIEIGKKYMAKINPIPAEAEEAKVKKPRAPRKKKEEVAV